LSPPFVSLIEFTEDLSLSFTIAPFARRMSFRQLACALAFCYSRNLISYYVLITAAYASASLRGQDFV